MNSTTRPADDKSVLLQTWQRQEGEPHEWYARFLLYRDMGPGRTMLGAVHIAEAQRDKVREAQGHSVSVQKRSKSTPGAWEKQARDWQWKRRAQAYDDEQQRLREQRRQAEEDAVLCEGLALPWRRVKALQEMEALVKDHIVASAEAAKKEAEQQSSKESGGDAKSKRRRQSKPMLSATLIEQWRGLLDDIAKEKGERVKKSEITGKDGTMLIPPSNTIALDVKKFTDTQLDQLLAILAEVEDEDETAATDREGGGAPR